MPEKENEFLMGKFTKRWMSFKTYFLTVLIVLNKGNFIHVVI